MPLDPAWKPVPCKADCKDANFWHVDMGMAAETCPTCGSHTTKDTRICLNACHLTKASQGRFADLMRKVR